MSGITQINTVPTHTVQQIAAPPPPREAQNVGPRDTGRASNPTPEVGRLVNVTT